MKEGRNSRQFDIEDAVENDYHTVRVYAIQNEIIAPTTNSCL